MLNIVIIGAGPAGLTAAYELLKGRQKDFKVTILEKSASYGGISRSVSVHGNFMDIGGHRFYSKDERVMKWWGKLMPMQGAPAMDDKLLGRDVPLDRAGLDPEKADRVMLHRDRVSRIYYGRNFYDYPISMKWETITNMGFVTCMRAGFSYLFATAFPHKENSLEDFFINRFGKVLYGMFFEEYTEKLWGRHPRNISANWGAQRVKGLSITAIIKDIIRRVLPATKDKIKVETSLIEQFGYPKFGCGQMWDVVAGDVVSMGAEVIMNARVMGLKLANDNITELTYIKDNVEHKLKADVFISSMPVKDLVDGFDACPDDVRRIATNLPYRDFVTIGLLLNGLNLVNKTTRKTLSNIVPDNWIYVQEPAVKMGRIQIFNNWSPYMVKDPINNVFVGCEYFCTEGDDFWNAPDDKLVALAEKELIDMGVVRSGAVLDAHVERVEKAYPAYFGTYKDMDKLITFLNKIDNLYCVGRNGQHRYNNMDHSMATAFEAVNNIKNGIKGKENLWTVNTEKKYHEEKNII
ncbi:NAD(P)/FAD-dependent oxidoreductase [Deferribacterales bacterium RsTz2092]|nr:hypothetical protein AGMMS49941_09580 [Deferribacterales bacterium]